MAKRYYQNKKDRMDESRGMKKAMGEYRGSVQKRSGSFDPNTGIMGDDPSMIANMPRENVCQSFTPLVTHNYEMNDTISRVGEQVRRDVSKIKTNVNFAFEK